MLFPTFFVLAACTGSSGDPPEKITGLWELHQVETAKGEVNGVDAVLARFPDCVWGRATWQFTDDHIEAAVDVLCPANQARDEMEMYGCSVTARVPATWEVASGTWKVTEQVTATSRTLGMGDGALPVPTKCSVTVPAGDYPVARVRSQRWKWEVRAPDGTVFRLRQPDSDRPDFVSAFRERNKDGKAKGAGGPAPTNVEPR